MTSVPLGSTFRKFAERESLRPDLARAARATIAFMIPMTLHAFGLLPVSAVFASIAAQHIAILDVRGDYRLRASLLAAMMLLLAGAGTLGALAAGHLAVAVSAAMLIAFGAALWRHLGSDYGPALSASSMLLFLVGLAHSQGPAYSLNVAGEILLGGAFGFLVQTALWPLRPQHPLRRAVSESWVAASDYFAGLHADRPPQDIAEAEASLRSALNQTARTLAGVAQRHKTTLPKRLEALNRLAARLAMRVGAVHTALDGLRGTPGHARLVTALTPALTTLTNTARSVAVTVVSRQPAHLTACEVRLRRLDALLEALQGRLTNLGGPSAAALSPLLERVRETLPEIAEALQGTLDRAGERALFALELTDIQTWQLKPLASALNFSRRFDPTLTRFGLRMAVFVGLGTFLYRWLEIPHGYWVPFTIVVVMQPDYGSTRKKALQRVSGTVAGSLAATVLLWTSLSAATHLVLIGFAAFGFAYFLKRRYALSVFFVTIFVVLLLEHTGLNANHIKIERIGATLLGGLIALIAAQLFWPVHERDRFPALFSRALRANRDYLAQIQTRFAIGGELNEETSIAKRAAETNAATLFASLGRLFADTRDTRAEVERLAALANGNQRVLRLSNLLAVGLRKDAIVTNHVIDAHFRALLKTLEHLADHAADPATVRPFELAARAADLDSLPTAIEGGSIVENLVTENLSRSVTEVRAMLAAAVPAENKQHHSPTVARPMTGA